MTPGELATIVAGGESEAVEYKATTGTRREAAATLCAMLNGRGGHVLFGVTPDGDIVGQQVGARTIEELVSELCRIEPPVSPEIERVRVAGDREAIIVHTPPGPAAPYRYRGVAYRRVGSTTQTMPAEEHNRILVERLHHEQRWENQPAKGWSIDDLDVAEIRNMVAEAVHIGRLNEPGSREPEDLLRGLGLLRDGVLSRAAAVLFGNAERLEFEMVQCLLRVARFRGTGRSEFLDNRQFHGNAFALLASAERFLRETLPIAGRFESGRMKRIDEPLYPPLATREALANAICHRDYAAGGGSIGVAVYDDRLEISSAGTLHFGLTPGDLFVPHESKPWNPLIAKTFFLRGIIEEWGSGTLKMAEMATSAGLPDPEIEEVTGCVIVRFWPSRELLARYSDVPFRHAASDLTDQQAAILRLLREADRALALREILSLTGQHVTERRLRKDLSVLQSQGLVEATGRGRGARWNPLQTNALAHSG